MFYSSSSKKTIRSTCFTGIRWATLAAWQIASSHWEIMVLGGGAEAEEWSFPHIIQQSCSHGGAWCSHHAIMTLSAVWHMTCVQTVSTWEGDVVAFNLFYVGHTLRSEAPRGGEDVLHAAHIGSQTSPLRCDFTSQRKSPCRVRCGAR